MKKAYLLIYDDEVGTREEIKNILNRMQIVETWRYDMPNMFYIISTYSAQQIAQQIRELSGDKGRLIVTENTGNSYGWLRFRAKRFKRVNLAEERSGYPDIKASRMLKTRNGACCLLGSGRCYEAGGYENHGW